MLEIGDTAWFGYGGVVSVETADALDVRLVWVIRFAEDDSVGVEDWTGRAMDLGPALGERELTGCPR